MNNDAIFWREELYKAIASFTSRRDAWSDERKYLIADLDRYRIENQELHKKIKPLQEQVERLWACKASY